MNLLAVEAFVAVVNLGSLHQAAGRLGVSSATISRRLTELETELGVRLVERTTRSLRVTDIGHAFYERCTRGFDAIAEALESVGSSETRVAGTVRISTAPSLGPMLLGPLDEVQRAHPEVRISLIETARRLDHRKDGIDVFVRVGEVTDERLVARPLGRYPHVLVASERYLKRAGVPASPNELESHAIIAFETGRRLTGLELVPERGSPVHVDVSPRFSSNDYTTITHAALADMGIAELPAIVFQRGGGLVRVLPRWTLGEVPLTLLFPSDRLLSRAVRVVIDHLLETVPRRVRDAQQHLETPGQRRG